MTQLERQKITIVGSGPAGYTAAIYAARAHLDPVLFEGFYSGPAGGQLMTTTEVENFPGFPKGVQGPELMNHCRAQAERFGARIIGEDVTSVDLKSHPFRVEGRRTQLHTNALIIATGATANRPDIPGTRDGEFWQKGVTACAICDGAIPLFRDRPLFVIGGGDSAAEEALYLTKFGSKVTIVHRRDKLRASKIMAKRVLEHPKIEIAWNSVIDQVLGEKTVTAVRIRDLKSGQVRQLTAAGVFFAVGHLPNSAFLQNQLKLDARGYIVVNKGVCTDIEGVFAAGDIADPHYRQAITSAGTGCMAAMDAERWLAEKGFDV